MDSAVKLPGPVLPRNASGRTRPPSPLPVGGPLRPGVSTSPLPGSPKLGGGAAQRGRALSPAPAPAGHAKPQGGPQPAAHATPKPASSPTARRSPHKDRHGGATSPTHASPAPKTGPRRRAPSPIAHPSSPGPSHASPTSAKGRCGPSAKAHGPDDPPPKAAPDATRPPSPAPAPAPGPKCTPNMSPRSKDRGAPKARTHAPDDAPQKAALDAARPASPDGSPRSCASPGRSVKRDHLQQALRLSAESHFDATGKWCGTPSPRHSRPPSAAKAAPATAPGDGPDLKAAAQKVDSVYRKHMADSQGLQAKLLKSLSPAGSPRAAAGCLSPETSPRAGSSPRQRAAAPTFAAGNPIRGIRQLNSFNTEDGEAGSDTESEGAASEADATSSAIRIQRVYRGHRARAALQERRRTETSAAIVVQSSYRGHKARVQARQLRTETRERAETREKAAITVQCSFRGHRARAEVEQVRQQKTRAAVTVQSTYRGHKTRQEVKVLKAEMTTAAATIQRGYREAADVLSQPYHELLTKANSTMLSLGLRFDLRGHGEPPPGADPPAAPGSFRMPPRDPSLLPGGVPPRSTTCFPGGPPPRSATCFPSATSQVFAAQPHGKGLGKRQEAEVQHSRELEQRIEQRDEHKVRLRESRDTERRDQVDGLRAAMWLTIARLLGWNLRRLRRYPGMQRVMQTLVIPMWRRYMHGLRRRVARRYLAACARPKVQPLTPDGLGACGPLFGPWPEKDLRLFIGKARLVAFRPGEYICRQGDPSHTLYVLAGGEVSVVIRSGTTKSRSQAAGVTVAALSGVRYFGEYGVFANEPRTATIRCRTAVVAWMWSKRVFDLQLRLLPRDVLKRVEARALTQSLEQLCSNIKQVYKLLPAQLAATLLFKGWDHTVLQDIINQLRPTLIPHGTVLWQANTFGTAVYWLCKGEVEQTSPVEGHPPILRGPPDQIGVRTCVFNEPHMYTATAVTALQVYCLDKTVLMDYMLMHPDKFLETKERVNLQTQATLPRPPVELLAHSPSSLLKELPAAVLQKLLGRLEARVREPHARVFQSGTGVHRLCILGHGSCREGERVLRKGDVIGEQCVTAGSTRWRTDVVALERVEGWDLDVEAAIEVLASSKKTRATEQLLALLAPFKMIARAA